MSFITSPQTPVPYVGEMGTIATPSWHCLFDMLTVVSVQPTSGAWPTTNTALFLPFEVWSPIIIDRAGVHNGSITVSGHFDVGIYDLLGNQLVSSGSTAQTPAATLQEVNLTDTVLAAGVYYMGLAVDNTTATFIRWLPSSTQLQTAHGIQQMASAFPLPNPATFANTATGYLPSLALSLRSTT